MAEDLTLVMAPLRGLTDEPFRTAFSRHFKGIDLAVAPFIASTPAEKLRDAHVRDVLPEKQHMPVVPQILSNNARDFLVLAHKLYDLGYTTVNWNLGCPYPMVAKKKRGSGLLPYPDIIAAFLDKVMPQLKPRLSIKLRLGYHSANEITALCPILNAHNLASVTLHPRIGVQMYGGYADVAAFVRAAKQINHKLVYNGDINNLAAFKTLQAKLPQIDSFMLGRYLLVNPFLAEELRGIQITAAEKPERFAAFYADLFALYQAKVSHPQHLMDRMKAYWYYFAAGFGREAHKQIKKIQRAQTLEAFCRYTATFLQNQPPRIADPWMT